MIHARNFLIIFIMLTGICWAGATTEYSWVRVDQPFQETIKIPLYGQASLDLDIPIEYLEGEKFLTFKMLLDTPFRSRDKPGETSAFVGFAPTVRVNDSKFSGVYPFRFKYKIGETYSEAFVKIKTKHLKAGRNNLTFSAGRDDFNYFWSCGGNRTNCTAIFIHKLWLDR
jgi:hypothetical protein